MFRNRVTPIFVSVILSAALLAGILAVSTVRAAGICYVKADASGANDGASWTDAYTDLQSTLGASPCTEVWVAAGVYKPTSGADRAATFTLKNGVALYGGFGGTETARDQRDPALNVTILSGDLLGNDGTNFANYSDNAYHVLSSSGVDSTAVLDGFTVKAGSADGGSVLAGGGMYNLDASPGVNNVIFSGNYAVFTGGAGMYNFNSHPAITNVTFADNMAATGKGAGLLNVGGSHPTLANVVFSANVGSCYGGGMANLDNSNPTLKDVTFSANKCFWGGGMYNLNSNPILSNVTFSGNTAFLNYADGGGMYNEASSPVLTDVTFINNSSGPDGGYGGGMYNLNGSAPTLTRVIFSGNKVQGCGGGMSNDGSSPILVSVIFSENESDVGGGMWSISSTPSLTNVTFTANTAIMGGAIYNYNSNPILTNVTFTANVASALGGAIHNYQTSALTLNNVTISGNTAAANGGGLSIASTSPRLNNVILWGNSAPSGAEIYNETGTADITDSIVAGGCPVGNTCTNVLTGDPKLAALANNGGFTKTMALQPGSAAIDAGGVNSTCANTDQRGMARPQGVACDIGAYELAQYAISGSAGTAGATLSYTNVSAQTATSAPDGAYAFFVPTGWSGAVTPSKAGYLFDPASKTYDNVTANKDGENYAADGLPTDISLSATSIAENQPPATAIGTLTTADPDPGDAFTYSLVDSATYPDNAAFQISGSTLKANAVFDFEIRAAYAVKIQTDDGHGGAFAKEFVISVMDVNDSFVTISGNAGIAGAILGYTDGAPKTVTADTNGDYSITIPYKWSGTVTPAKANYTFLPESRAYTNLTANPGGENYTATLITYTAAISSSGAYDGWILASSETSNKGGSLDATASTFRLGDDALNRQYRSILSFNTSSLPDGAVITSVTLKFRKNPVAGVSLISKFGGLVVEVKKGYFGASAKLQAGDFQARASKAFGPFKPIPANGWVTINLNSAAFPYINKSSAYQSGHTQLRLGYKLDDNNNNIANFMSFSSGNALSSQPQLIITYIIP